ISIPHVKSINETILNRHGYSRLGLEFHLMSDALFIEVMIFRIEANEFGGDFGLPCQITVAQDASRSSASEPRCCSHTRVLPTAEEDRRRSVDNAIEIAVDEHHLFDSGTEVRTFIVRRIDFCKVHVLAIADAVLIDPNTRGRRNSTDS